jgi:hypothetical protein
LKQQINSDNESGKTGRLVRLLVLQSKILNNKGKAGKADKRLFLQLIEISESGKAGRLTNWFS